MKLTKLMLILGVFTPLLAAGADLVDYAEGKFFGERLRCRLVRAELFAGPKWNPTKERVPLSPEKAREVAVTAAYMNLGTHPLWKSRPGWYVNRLQLVSYRDQEHWYYQVDLKPFASGTGDQPNVVCFVLLNGNLCPLDRWDGENWIRVFPKIKRVKKLKE